MLTSLACFMRRDEAAMQARLTAAADKQAEAAAAARRAAAGEAVDGEGEGITGISPLPASPSLGVRGSGSGRGGPPSLPPGLPGFGVGGSAHGGLPGSVPYPYTEYGGLGRAPPYGYGWQQGGGGAPGWPAEDRRAAKERLLGPGVAGSSSAQDMSHFTIADDHDHDNNNDVHNADGGQPHGSHPGETQYQYHDQRFDPRHRPVNPQPVVPAHGSVPGAAQGAADGTHGAADDLGAGWRGSHGQAHADGSGRARPGPAGDGSGGGGAGGVVNGSEGAGGAVLLPVSCSAGAGEEAQLQPAAGAGAGGWGGTASPLPQAPLLPQELAPQAQGDWRGQQHGEGPSPPPPLQQQHHYQQQQEEPDHHNSQAVGGRSSSGDVHGSGPHGGQYGASQVPIQDLLAGGLLPQGGVIGEVHGSGGPAASAGPPAAAPSTMILSPPPASGAPLGAVLEGQPPGRPAAGQSGVAWS